MLKYSVRAGIFMLALFMLTALGVSASDAIHAPGGIVNDPKSLFLALGGESAALLDGDTVTMRYDVILDAPVVFAGGEHMINGMGCIISRGCAGAMFVICGDASLTMGDDAGQKSSDDIIIDGSGSQCDGSVVDAAAELYTHYALGDDTPELHEDRPIVMMTDESSLMLCGGAHLQGNISRAGGGVAVHGSADFELRGGLITACAALYGGGVFVDGGTFTATGGVIDDCRAVYGGGVYITENEISDSTAALNSGRIGGIVSESDQLDGSYEISGGCRAVCGGGLYIARGATVIGGADIVACIAETDGGGIYSVGGVISLERGAVMHCTAKGNGGGVYNATDMTVGSFKISENTAGYGGGIFNIGKGMLNGADIISNIASGGGGIWNSGEMTLEYGSTIRLNHAQSGGGIFTSDSADIYSLILRCGIVSNKANSGSGIAARGDIDISGYAYITENDLALIKTVGSFPTINISGEITVPGTVAPVTLLLDNSDNPVHAGYSENGMVILTGEAEAVAAASTHFSFTENSSWKITPDGRLDCGASHTLLIIIVTSAVVIATASVIFILRRRKNKEKTNAASD